MTNNFKGRFDDVEVNCLFYNLLKGEVLLSFLNKSVIEKQLIVGAEPYRVFDKNNPKIKSCDAYELKNGIRIKLVNYLYQTDIKRNQHHLQSKKKVLSLTERTLTPPKIILTLQYA